MADEVRFVVHEDGRATLYVAGTPVCHVGNYSGMETLDVFNKLMASHDLPYRLKPDYSSRTAYAEAMEREWTDIKIKAYCPAACGG